MIGRHLGVRPVGHLAIGGLTVAVLAKAVDELAEAAEEQATSTPEGASQITQQAAEPTLSRDPALSGGRTGGCRTSVADSAEYLRDLVPVLEARHGRQPSSAVIEGQPSSNGCLRSVST